MKLMIASDIHGSAQYCGEMLEAYKREKADKLLLLGDILYHGPRNNLPERYAPKEVIAMLNPMCREILCVRGNCDTEVDQMVLELPIMAEYAFFRTGWYLSVCYAWTCIQSRETAYVKDWRYFTKWAYACSGM